ncbi:MAG: MCE family protein [Candidatus Hydrogenedentota bacterium]|nr:MAG: MCE family protein [Candidatus Hydrogenedentota bacterium]
MTYRADEVKAGLVVVGSLLILAGFIVTIVGLKIGQPTETYTTTLRFAGGIEPGTVVRFGGMHVGKVASVNVSGKDDTRIQLTVKIAEGVPVKTDSEVFINTIGFLGDYYLEISTGSQGSPPLPPGSEIRSREIASLNDMLAQAQSAVEKVDAAMVIVNERILTEDLANLRGRIREITDRIEQVLIDVEQVLNEENRENISHTLAQLRMLIQENRDDVHATVGNFRTASQRLESLATSLDSVISENRESIDILIEDIRATVILMRSAAERIDRLVAENADDIALTIDNLKATTDHTRDFGETISDEPWRLIWRTRQPNKKAFEQEETGTYAR